MSGNRKQRLDLYTPAELQIRNSILEVEKIGADVRLTDAVINLQKALDKVQDVIIEKEKEVKK